MTCSESQDLLQRLGGFFGISDSEVDLEDHVRHGIKRRKLAYNRLQKQRDRYYQEAMDCYEGEEISEVKKELCYVAMFDKEKEKLEEEIDALNNMLDAIEESEGDPGLPSLPEPPLPFDPFPFPPLKEPSEDPPGYEPMIDDSLLEEFKEDYEERQKEIEESQNLLKEALEEVSLEEE